MSNDIFRKKSLTRMQSPDNLKEYIRVINPSLWIVFIAAFLLLVGAFVWGSVGKIEDKISVTIVSKNGAVISDYSDAIQTGMKVILNNREGEVSSVTPYNVTYSFSEYIPDGVYTGYVILGYISPISFVFN